jgi:hypothetical protein
MWFGYVNAVGRRIHPYPSFTKGRANVLMYSDFERFFLIAQYNGDSHNVCTLTSMNTSKQIFFYLEICWENVCRKSRIPKSTWKCWKYDGPVEDRLGVSDILMGQEGIGNTHDGQTKLRSGF